MSVGISSFHCYYKVHKITYSGFSNGYLAGSTLSCQCRSNDVKDDILIFFDILLSIYGNLIFSELTAVSNNKNSNACINFINRASIVSNNWVNFTQPALFKQRSHGFRIGLAPRSLEYIAALIFSELGPILNDKIAAGTISSAVLQ